MPQPISSVTWTGITSIDHEKAWQVLRRLEPAELLVLFSRALRFVPPENLGAVFRDHAQPHELAEAGSELAAGERRSWPAWARAFDE